MKFLLKIFCALRILMHQYFLCTVKTEYFVADTESGSKHFQKLLRAGQSYSW